MIDQTHPDAQRLAVAVWKAIPSKGNVYRVLDCAVWSARKEVLPRKVLTFRTDQGERMYLLPVKRGAQIATALQFWRSDEGILVDCHTSAWLVLIWNVHERPVDASNLGCCIDSGSYSACIIDLRSKP